MACKNHPDREAVAICVECQAELCSECRQIGSDGKSYCAEHLPRPEPAPAGAQAPEGAPVELPPRGEQEAVTATPGESTGLAAACYFAGVLPPLSFILPIIPLISADMKKSRYMRYHAYNGLFWGLAVVVGLVLLQIVLAISGLLGIPGILIWPLKLLRGVWWVAALVISIGFAIKANGRESVRIPVVSDLADGQAK